MLYKKKRQTGNLLFEVNGYFHFFMFQYKMSTLQNNHSSELQLYFDTFMVVISQYLNHSFLLISSSTLSLQYHWICGLWISLNQTFYVQPKVGCVFQHHTQFPREQSKLMLMERIPTNSNHQNKIQRQNFSI